MDPIQRFSELLERAKKTPGVIEATAFTLSTVGPDNRPAGRVVLLKGCDAHGLVFYTNTLSRKGREVRAHPDVAMTFWWPQLEQQVRFEGKAVPVPAEEADAYFASRVRLSQLAAWASHQSEPLASREELEKRLAHVTEFYEGKPVDRPPHWSGYRVAPVAVEFWRNVTGRLHERELFTRPIPTQPWSMTLLNP